MTYSPTDYGKKNFKCITITEAATAATKTKPNQQQQQ